MADHWDGHERRNQAEAELAAEAAADRAVAKVFAILGVDIKDPREVEEFRKSLRWSDSMRRAADHGWLVFIGMVTVTIGAALWAGVVQKVGGK